MLTDAYNIPGEVAERTGFVLELVAHASGFTACMCDVQVTGHWEYGEDEETATYIIEAYCSRWDQLLAHVDVEMDDDE